MNQTLARLPGGREPAPLRGIILVGGTHVRVLVGYISRLQPCTESSRVSNMDRAALGKSRVSSGALA